MKVIADLHAIQGLQNGNISGIRDGFQEWGDSNIKNTMVVINFLAKKFNILNFYSYYKYHIFDLLLL